MTDMRYTPTPDGWLDTTTGIEWSRHVDIVVRRQQQERAA